MSNSLKYELQLNTAEAEKQMNEFIEKGKKKVADMEKSASKSTASTAIDATFEKKVKAQAKMLAWIEKEEQKKRRQKEQDDKAYTQWWEKQLNAQAKKEEMIEKKQYSAQRSLASAANRAYHVDQQKKIEITARAHQDIQHIVANSANQTVEDTRRQIQLVVDTTKQELAKLEMEAARQGGRGYGSFSNNMFQIGQTVEDFNVGFQLNGWLGGLRGASNNVALLLSQIEGVNGVIAQMGFMALVTGAQIAIFMNDAEGAADATDEFTNKLIEARFGFRQLTDEALNYRKQVISAITDTATEGLEPFVNQMDALERKQEAIFAIDDARQYANEIGRTATKLRDLVRAEKDVQLAQEGIIALRRQGGVGGGDSMLEDAGDWRARADAEMQLKKAQDALITRQQEYMRLAKELDLPDLNAQLKEYAELETLLAQSTVENIEEKQARYEELRQTMLETFEKVRQETVKEAEEERKRIDLLSKTTELIRTQAEAVDKLAESEAGRNADGPIAQIRVRTKLKERELLDTLLSLQDKLNHAEGDERKEIQQAIIRVQGEIVDLYENQENAVQAIVDKEKERLDILHAMERSVDHAVDAGKERMNQIKQELRDEEQKLETYKKQLATLQLQQHAHKVGGKLGLIGGKETFINTEANETIQNIQKQADAHKKMVQQQVQAQNQLAQAFGGVSVNADAYLNWVDAKAEWLINQVKAKQKEYMFLFNREREEELRKEVAFQMKMAAQAGTPEEKLAAIERAIKAQEDLRQLQLSQVGEGGQFGIDKLKQYTQSGKLIEQLYLKQAMVLKEATAEAEKQKVLKQEEAAVLEATLLRLDEIKKALNDKDIIKDVDVTKAKQIEQSMLVIANAMQASGLASAAFSINQLGQGLGLPGFANGGVFDGRGPILVGEKGPEIIFPQSGGLVLTNQESQRLMSTLWASQSFGGGSTTNVSTNIGTVNIQGPPVSTGNNLATQLRNSRYAARTRKR